jgi:hypothetical protein
MGIYKGADRMTLEQALFGGYGHFRTIDLTCELGRIANLVCWRQSGYMITWSCAVSFLPREGPIGTLDRQEGAVGNIHALSPMFEK